jgi:hypothetical protein
VRLADAQALGQHDRPDVGRGQHLGANLSRAGSGRLAALPGLHQRDQPARSLASWLICCQLGG